MSRLLWVRHGVTAENHNKQYLGQLDVPLSAQGRIQAEQLAERLRHLPINAVYSSNLQRCMETASEICRFHPHLDIHPSADLRELAFGRWEGKTYEQIAAEEEQVITRFYEDPWRNAPPGGETVETLAFRLQRFVEQVLCAHSTDETILIVSHRGVIGLFYALYLEQRRDALFSLQIDPCEGLHCAFDYQLGKWTYATS
ncbi:histidine phosphatase family protein [Brevibacillus humidisoli]|uniref:histidine phosphatase family protein n=1 Tax=Brevibacillus humidisoli TaxID=2895522 RepID=UPI001E4081FD|nr:histidine phosphatase family protein [Brevibacillus humidisoli]UFJ42648.1 histidine phosphatase family protein [Brevibacillus humidisoli]